MIFLVLLGKMIFLFPENMTYSLGEKEKMIFLKINTWKYNVFFKCSEKLAFQKKNHT